MFQKLRKRYVGDRAFYKMTLGIAVPIMIQNGISNFVSMLDNIMVGNVSAEQMSGVSIVNQLIFVFNLMIFGAVSGAGIFGAQFYGSGDTKGLRDTFRFKIISCGLHNRSRLQSALFDPLLANTGESIRLRNREKSKFPMPSANHN